jgi:O-antigen ligase
MRDGALHRQVERSPTGSSVNVTRVALAVLALLVFSIPSENGLTIPGVGSIPRLIGFAAVGMVLVSLYDSGRLRFRAPSLFLLAAAAFVFWTALTSFWSLAPATSISQTVQFVQLLVFAWMVHQLARTERDRDMLMQAFVLGCYLMIAIAMVAAVGSDRGGYRDVTFPANSFASVAALAIPMAWGLMLRRSYPLLQALNMVYPVLALVAVVLAASRGGLLTALVGLTIIPFTLPRLGLIRRLVLTGAVAAVAVSTFTWLPQAVPDLERNLERLGRVEEDLVEGTMTGRTTIWTAGGQVFLSSPLVGVGAGAYGQAVAPILGSARSAHNAFLSVAVTSGLVGVSLFISMFMVVVVGLIASPERRTDQLVLFIALVVAAMPANAENNKFLWYILAVLAAARPLMVRVQASAEQLQVRPARAIIAERSKESSRSSPGNGDTREP